MKLLSLIILGEPVSRQAHTHAKGFTFLPKESKHYQERVRAYAAEAMKGTAPIDCTVHVDICFRFPAPKSLRKAERLHIQNDCELIYARINKDIDNLQKNLFDGLKGVAIQDDKQIVRVTAKKVLHKIPSTIVTIYSELA